MFKKIILLISIVGLIFLGISFAKNSARPDVLGFGERKLPMPRDFGRLIHLVERLELPEQQCKMGDILYFYGKNYLGYFLSKQEAVSYWQDACRDCQGQEFCSNSWASKACFRLGKYFFKTEPEKAEIYFKKSAELGHSESKMIVAMLEIKKERTVNKGHYTLTEPRKSERGGFA